MVPQSAVAAGPGIIPVSVLATDITETTAIIRWSTYNVSDSNTVYYGTSTPLSLHENGPAGLTDHQVILEDLEPGQVYFYYVESDGERFPVEVDEYRSFETLTSPGGYYKITLDHDCGVCGDLWKAEVCGEVIGVTAVVAVEGDYRICWDSRSSADVVDGGTFHAAGPGTYTLTFHMPETTGGIHEVYLTNTAYNDLGEDAVAEFVVNPSVKLSSDSPPEYPENEGPVGTEVTLNGYGFNDEDEIRVEFNDTVVSSTNNPPPASSKGSWEFSYTIPDTPGGSHTFDIGPQSNPDVVLLTKYFKVIPEITAPESATVGQTIQVKGTGFQSEESNIEITFRSQTTDVEVVVMEGIVGNQDGSWTEEIVVPTLQRGNYFIDASGESTRARDVTDIKVTLVPGIFLNRSSAPVGDPITVKGGGFTSEETGIRVTFAGRVVASGITANEDGTWTASFDVPVSTFGSHPVSASGDRTSAVENTLDTEAQITMYSPDEGAPGDLVSVTGNGFHGGQGLTVTIGGVAASGNLQTQSNGNVVINFRVPGGSPYGTQHIVVTDEGGATDQVDFTVTEKTLSTTPLPVSPKGNTLRSGDVTFQWQGETDSTAYTYIIEVNTTPSSGNIWFKSNIPESSYTLTENEALPGGTYYWRVKVVDDYGNEGDWSDYAEFAVSPIPIWVWVVVGVVVLVTLMVVAYRETKFRVTE
jgi:hypothetical protein